MLPLCRNDNQVNNRLVLLLNKDKGEQEVYWKDIVAGDLIKVSAGMGSSWPPCTSAGCGAAARARQLHSPGAADGSAGTFTMGVAASLLSKAFSLQLIMQAFSCPCS
jgi:hypothetical protein